MKNQTIKTIALSALTSSLLLGAPPSAGDIEKQIVIPKIVKEKQGVNNFIPEFAPKLQVGQSIKKEVPLQKVQITNPKANKPSISGFDFIGNDSISDAALLEVAKSYIGNPLTPETLFELQSKLTRFYQSKGFKKARAYTYLQNIKNEVVTFEIRARDTKGHQALMAKKNYITPNMNEKKFLKDLGYDLEYKGKGIIVEPIVKAKEVSTALITKFEYEGNVHVTNESLDELLKSYLDKSYSFEELQSITSLVTKHYRKHGYFVARAYISPNALNGETFKISIIEGNYGEFKLTNNSLVNDKQVQGVLDNIKDANIISVATLERAMLLINDTPGAKVVKADVMPGTKVGTSNFLIKTEATKPYSAYILGDNYGSRYTGKYRVNLGLSANSPLGYGDKLSFNGVVSTTGDLKNGKVSYGFPLMNNGLRGEISASKTTYSLAKEYLLLDAIGNSTTLEAKLSYPLIRTRQETLKLSMGIARKNMEDEVRSTTSTTKKDATVLKLGTDYTRSCLLLGYNSSTTASLNISYGNLSFNDAISKALDSAGANTNGTYSKIEGIIEKAIQFNPKYSLTTSLRFQKALGNKNLNGSEDFSLGGAYGVRAFPDGEHSAENGYVLGAEFFYALPSIEGINHKVSIFADTGYATMENELSGNESRQLSDIGLGYQAYYKEFFVKTQLARVIGGEKVTSETEYKTRALLQVGWFY